MKWLAILCLFIIAGCDWKVPSSNEGIVLQSTDSLNAFDSTKKDSIIARPDSIKIDKTQNADTTELNQGEIVNTKNVDPGQILQYAQTLIGTPYRYGSTDPKVGFDCSGFITHVFNRFSITVPRSSIDFTNVGKEVSVTQAKPGDLILFTGTDSTERFVGHMGIVFSNGKDSLSFIHSTSGKAYGVTISPLSQYYKGRFVKTIRIFKQNDS